MSKIHASFIHAGGEGKTATLVSLASALALRGRRVALLDFDPQGTASGLLGYSFEDIDPEDTILGCLRKGKMRWKKPEALKGNLSLLPAHLDMETLNYDLYIEFGLREVFGDCLKQIESSDDFDHVLIDLPPSNNPISNLALLKAHGVIIPVTPTPKGVAGAQQAVQLLHKVRAQRPFDKNGYPKISLVVINKVERTKLHSEYAKRIRELMEGELGIPTVTMVNRPGLYADAAALGVPVPVLIENASEMQKLLGRRLRSKSLARAKEEIDQLVEAFLKREAEV